MILTRNLNAGYGDVQVLFDISANIDSNKITAVVGPNGSGKSTLLKAIFGLTKVYSGNVIFKDEDITNIPAYKRTKLGIAYLPQVDNVFTDLSVEENLKIAGYTLDKKEYEVRKGIALRAFPELRKFLDRKSGTLSGGERQFLAIATALIRKADVLMLDEPTAQLSPKFAQIIFDKIIELRDDFELTIILVEQNVTKALEISEKVYLLVSGKVAFEGTSNALKEHEKFEKLLMGLL